MENQKALRFIEDSFLSPLLNDPNVTDITYNGECIYYLDNYHGRQKSNIQIDDSQAKDFIRQIANLAEKQFSFQSPKLNVSVGRYRINAVHPSIARINNDRCLNFAIRIASSSPIITNESTFLNAELISLFRALLKSNVSIVIGGTTGSGKTELQRYLIRSMPSNTRIVVIDNILELDNLVLERDLDINIWQSDEKNNETTIQELVKNALRSNPDWLIVAESRGKEMVEVLNSAMTGHPIITTIHALSINGMPTRIGRMVLMNEKQNQDFDILMQDIYYCFRFYIYLKREIVPNGLVKRYIEEISEFDQTGKKTIIYQNLKGNIMVNKIREEALKLLSYEDDDEFKKFYVEENK